MRLPGNSLGISDAMQYHRCPALFFHNMMRHVRGEKPIEIAGQFSEPLAYGNAVHEAALAAVQDPDIYVDDAVDLAWREWGHLLEPRNHVELKRDVETVIARTLEAPNLKLIAAEKDMSVPLFIGTPGEDTGDEEEDWYSYRFRIDALYVDTNDPTHFVIRDFKTYRRKKWQEEIDDDPQFTAYSWGVKQLFPNASKVTIWIDQVKHGETFTKRTVQDEQEFAEWMRSTMRAVLAKSTEEIAGSPKLNDYCSWCPLLATCEIKDYATDFAKATVAALVPDADGNGGVDLGNVNDVSHYVYTYEEAKKALKVLEAYKDKVEVFLKDNPGEYGERTYTVSDVSVGCWPVEKVAEVVGVERALAMAKPLSKKAIDPLMAAHGPALDARKSEAFGYRRLNSKAKKGLP